VQTGPHFVRNALLIAVMVALVSAGTYAVVTSKPAASASGVKVLATFYPVYDYARNIGGDRIDVSLLVPMTLDVHAFEPTPSSVQAVATANVLIYGGAGLEPWIPSIVAAAGNPGLVLVDSSANISLLLVTPAFQRENRTIDPHIWLNPVLAKQQVANILRGLIRVDPADAAYFTANAQAYDAKLDVLNAEFVNLTANPVTRYFVTFHEAFAYFAKQYNVIQIPIAGPFEEDPTPSEIQNVIDAVHAHHLCYVGYESLTNPAIAQSIASQTNATLIRLDPIEGLSTTDQALGKTYLLKMQDDFTNFALALNHVGCS
jgi:zinc transport system substrate-binding protein